MNASHRHLVKATHWTWLYVLLILAAVWNLAPAGFSDLRRLVVRPAGAEHWSQLDSFSGPAVASAVLKGEAERLSLAFRDCADREIEAATAGASPVSAQGTPSVERAATLQAMEDLRGEAQELKTDLLLKLLGAYAESGLWREFLDRYLEFVHEAPDNPFVVAWASGALIHAPDCSRTDEVVQALERLAVRNPNSKVARQVRTVLGERGAQSQGHLTVHMP